jgi:hypothetical protein
VGLFGFRESISASDVVESLTIETISVLALITWTVLVTATPSHGSEDVRHNGMYRVELRGTQIPTALT